MEVVRKWLTLTQVIQFNNCPLYLCASTISDISLTVGDVINPAYLTGDAQVINLWLDWPNIAQPPPAHYWRAFHWGILCAFVPAHKGQGRLPCRITLAQPFGEWIYMQHHTNYTDGGFMITRTASLRSILTLVNFDSTSVTLITSHRNQQHCRIA